MDNSLRKAIDFRHNLHKYPELSGEEIETTRKIKAVLSPLENCKILPLGERGLLAEFSSTESGPTVLIRGDIDALPITDDIDASYKSIYEGIGHKCGHDGHTSILYRLAMLLNDRFPGHGTVYLLFQPAEENGQGAREVIHAPEFTIDCDYVFALHNLPAYPTSQVVLSYETFACSVVSCDVTVQGKSAHAAEPQNAYSPVPFINEILQELKSTEDYDLHSTAYFLCTPIYIDVPKKNFGTTPDSGSLGFTLRCNNNKSLDEKKVWFQREIEGLAQKYHLSTSVKWSEEFRAVENDADAVDIVKSCADKLSLSTAVRDTPFSWGEDFGLFTEKFSGAMFGLGSGEEHVPLHDPCYDFNDELISSGSSLFYEIIRSICT